MNEGLPEGLIDTKGNVAGDLEENDHIDFDDIKRLWKIHAANRHIIPGENVGRRLENLFWRIMSCHQVLDNIGGNQIATLFNSIHENSNIRTTPRSSPRSSSGFGVDSGFISSGSSNSESRSSASLIGQGLASQDSPPYQAGTEEQPHGKNGGSSNLQEDEGDAPTPTPSSPFANLRVSAPKSTNQRRRSHITKPTPILKKSSSERSEESTNVDDGPGSATTKASSATSIASTRHTATRFNEEVAVSIPKVSTSPPRNKTRRNTNEVAQVTSKKGPVFVANTGASKRKPIMTRQRSSQSTQSKGSVSPPTWGSSRTGSTTTTLATTRSDLGTVGEGKLAPEPTSSTRDRLQEGPKVFKQGQDPQQPAGSSSHSQAPGRPSAPQRSFTNLAAFGRRAGAASTAAASYHASGLLDLGQPLPAGKEAFHNETVRLKDPAPEAPEMKSEVQLPRTKSQLTLLLEKAKGGSSEDLSKRGKD